MIPTKEEDTTVEPIIEIKNLTHIYSPNTPFQQTALDNMDSWAGASCGVSAFPSDAQPD